MSLGDTVKVEPSFGRRASWSSATSLRERTTSPRALVRELESRLDRTFDVRVTIRKRVPDAAGLGGGSSDAATTLIGLERLFGLDLEPRLRHEVAAAVGSDVPFFLWPGPQLVMGRGQVLKDVAVPDPLHLVIAVPDLALSTADVYRWRDEARLPDLREFAPRTALLTSTLFAAAAPRDLVPLVVNDLEPVVAARHPVVAELKEALLGRGAFAAAMSGSGPSVYGLFGDEEAARAARGSLAERPPRRPRLLLRHRPAAEATGGAAAPYGSRRDTDARAAAPAGAAAAEPRPAPASAAARRSVTRRHGAGARTGRSRRARAETTVIHSDGRERWGVAKW